MSEHKQMVECIREAPVVTTVQVVHDSKELAEMTEATRAEKNLPAGAIMVFEAKVFHAGKVTANGRLYMPQLMRAESARLAEDIKERRVKGLAGHPEPDKAPDPSTTCLIPLGLRVEDSGAGYMQAAVPDTSKGRDLAALARMGVKVGFSQRGRGLSRKVEMTDKHPCWFGNEHWAGKQVDEVNDQYTLETFDWVDNQAVRDAELSNYHESEDETVEFKIEELNEDQWKTILESDKVKAVMADTRKDVTREHVAKLAESGELAKLLAGNKELAEGLAKNDAFLAALDEAIGDDTEPEKKMECTTCKKQIVEGAIFCPSCGARQVLTEGQEPDKPADEKEKAIKAIMEAKNKQDERLAKLEAELKARDDKAVIDKTIAEAVQDKAEKIQEAVRVSLGKRKDLTPDNIADETKAEVEFIEGLLGNQAADDSTNTDTGKGQSQPADEGRQDVHAEGKDKNVDGEPEADMSEAMKRNMEILG